MKEEEFYKVVRLSAKRFADGYLIPFPDLFLSAIDRGKSDKFELPYMIGRRTRPVKGTYIYAFDNLVSAKEFYCMLRFNSAHYIFAIMRGVGIGTNRVPYAGSDRNKFWELYSELKVSHSPDLPLSYYQFMHYEIEQTPKGSVWLRWFKPIEILEEDKLNV